MRRKLWRGTPLATPDGPPSACAAQVRELAAEVQAVGNLLQEALLREGEMSRARARAFATDTQVVQDQLREAVQGVRGSAHNMEAQADQMDKERRALEGKMRKRADELERQRQR